MPSLTEIADIGPSLDRTQIRSLDEVVSFVSMASVSETSGTVISEEPRVLRDVLQGFTTFKDGDILVAKITPCFENGKIVHARIKTRIGFGSTEFHVVRPKSERLDDRYLFHFLRQAWIREAGERRMTGSAGQRRVPRAFLAELNVPLPSLPEQRRIAAILDKAETLRATRRDAIAKLDQLLQSVFLDMFGRDSAWPKVAIGDICCVKGGKRLPKGEEYSDTPTPYRYIRVSDIKMGRVLDGQLKYLKPEVQQKIKRYTVAPGDVVITIAGTIGTVAPIDEGLNGANLTENAAKLVPLGNADYEPDYLAFALGAYEAQQQIIAQTGQVTIGKLALFRIEKVIIQLPPKDVQSKFVQLKRGFSRQLMRLESSARLLEGLFSSLQHEALRAAA